MASACFESAGFSLYGRDWIGCVLGGTLISKGCREHEPYSSLDEEKKVRVFCECRTETVDSARVPTGSVQCKVYPGASSVPEAEEEIRISSRADIEVRGVSSEESGVVLES